MSIKERIQTALGNYYDKHIEPKIIIQMSQAQQESFKLDYPFD